VDFLQNLAKLTFGPDQRIDVLDRARVLVLRRGSAPGRKQGFAGRVGDQMEVEETLRLVHKNCRGLLRSVDGCGSRPAPRGPTVSDGDLSTIRCAPEKRAAMWEIVGMAQSIPQHGETYPVPYQP